MKTSLKSAKKRTPANRVSTGIDGLDTILFGGYPQKSPTLIRGASGCGKTMFALSFATAKGTPSEGIVYLTFDESPARLQSYIDNWRSKTKITFLDVRPDPDTLI